MVLKPGGILLQVYDLILRLSDLFLVKFHLFSDLLQIVNEIVCPLFHHHVQVVEQLGHLFIALLHLKISLVVPLFNPFHTGTERVDFFHADVHVLHLHV